MFEMNHFEMIVPRSLVVRTSGVIELVDREIERERAEGTVTMRVPDVVIPELVRDGAAGIGLIRIASELDEVESDRDLPDLEEELVVDSARRR